MGKASRKKHEQRRGAGGAKGLSGGEGCGSVVIYADGRLMVNGTVVSPEQWLADALEGDSVVDLEVLAKVLALRGARLIDLAPVGVSGPAAIYREAFQRDAVNCLLWVLREGVEAAHGDAGTFLGMVIHDIERYPSGSRELVLAVAALRLYAGHVAETRGSADCVGIAEQAEEQWGRPFPRLRAIVERARSERLAVEERSALAQVSRELRPARRRVACSL